MKTQFKNGIVLAFISLLFFTFTAQASVKLSEIEYDHGIVSLTSGRFSLLAVLKKLASVAKIEIYITGKFSDSSKQIGFDRTPIHDALCTLLKGYSFAVIYSDDSDTQGHIYLYGVNGTHVPAENSISLKQGESGQISGSPVNGTALLQDYDPSQDNVSQNMTPLEHKIQKLEKEIESGRADAWYESWAKIRDPKYVANPRDKLVRYQKELQKKQMK
ncbi:MAG: hypothetical protein ABIJ31_10010 [Pseudomonadota bacterium]